MIEILALIQLILIIKICVDEINHKSPAAFLWATLLIMFGVTHFINVIGYDLHNNFNEIVMNKASLFVIFFCLLYRATRSLLTRKNAAVYGMRIAFTNLSLEHMRHDQDFRLLYIILIFVSIYKVFTFIRFAGNILNTSWSQGREMNYDYVSGQTIISISYFTFSGLFLASLIRQEYRKSIISALCIIMMAVITRNRITVTPLLIGIIAPFLLRNRRIGILFILKGLASTLIVLIIVYGLLAFRHYGSLGQAFEKISAADMSSRIVTMLREDRGELALHNWFYYFIKHDNLFASFGRGHTYIRMLMVFIPTRFSLGLKPDDFAQAMGAAIGMGPGGSTHPTLFGDCYANLGFMGIFLGIFWATLITKIDKIILNFEKNELKVLAYSLCASMYTIIGRGAVYNAFFEIAYGILILYIMDRSNLLSKRLF